jgi:predicted aspartyl protease
MLACSPAMGTTVPLEFETGRPAIDLTINGKGPYRLLFDTGSGAGLILDKAIADELGLKSTGKRRIGDPNSPDAIEADTMKVGRVTLGDLTLKHVEAISWNREALGSGAARGVVGLSLFGPRVVTLDYPGHKFIVEAGALPEADGRTVLSATFDDGIPSVPIDVAGTGYRAHLDSGSTGFIGMPLASAEKVPLDGPLTKVGRARTASGDYSVSEAKLSGYLRVGDIMLEAPKLRFVDLPSANLGSDFLRTMVVSVDSKNGRVKLVGSGQALEPSARPPRFGIMSHGLKDGRFPVEDVAAGSPAEAAGLKAGDEIVSLNDQAVADMNPFQLSQALLARPLAIALLRDGEPFRLTVGDPPPGHP